MTKFPRLGEVKTRMIPELGAEAATELHRAMAERTIHMARSISTAQTIVHIAGCTIAEAQQWLGEGTYQKQHGLDLGERMQYAVELSIQQHAQMIVIVGTDCPDLNDSVIEQAFHSLSTHDLVYAPAYDGGYVLIGMKTLAQEVFSDIDWGSEHVLQQSLTKAEQASYTYQILSSMQDVDYPEDIPEQLRSQGI